MRLATWNVNGLRARLDYIDLWLQDRQPDIVGLQELKTPDDLFPHEHFEALGYQALVHGQKSWNGVAILAKHPMTLKQQGLQDQEDFGARLITAEVTTPKGTVFDFTTVYCPNGKTLEHADFGRKLEWYKSLNAYWQQNAVAKHLICGDFNIVPEAIDGWRGEKGEGTIFYTKEERQHLQDFVDLGLTDLFRNRYPDRQEFSWWDYRGGAFHRKHGLRIDFLLATQPLVDATTEVIIDRDYRRKIEDLTASDHAPVFADLNI